MGYLGTKPANSPLTSELIPNSIITNAKINDVAATKLTGQVADANAPSGSVVQVVQTIKSDTATITYNNPSNWINISGLSASITPQNTSSRILVMVQVQLAPSAANYFMGALRTTRNGTAIGLGNAASGYEPATVSNQRIATDTNAAVVACYQVVDSPSTTSALTYQVQIAGEAGSNVRINTSGSDAGSQTYSWRAISTITLMEIAG